MNQSLNNLREIVGLMQAHHEQQALIQINDALDSMSAGNPCFNPMIKAAALIQFGALAVVRAKTILEELFVKLNTERE
jgi:hypothetical protein